MQTKWAAEAAQRLYIKLSLETNGSSSLQGLLVLGVGFLGLRIELVEDLGEGGDGVAVAIELDLPFLPDRLKDALLRRDPPGRPEAIAQDILIDGAIGSFRLENAMVHLVVGIQDVSVLHLVSHLMKGVRRAQLIVISAYDDRVAADLLVIASTEEDGTEDGKKETDHALGRGAAHRLGDGMAVFLGEPAELEDVFHIAFDHMVDDGVIDRGDEDQLLYLSGVLVLHLASQSSGEGVAHQDDVIAFAEIFPDLFVQDLFIEMGPVRLGLGGMEQLDRDDLAIGIVLGEVPLEIFLHRRRIVDVGVLEAVGAKEGGLSRGFRKVESRIPFPLHLERFFFHLFLL